MTKQRKILTEFLSHHADESLTAREVAAALQGFDISVSSVYRNLAALEEDGALRRLPNNGNREAVYQYRDAHACREHLHMSCTQCGRTYHMKTPHAARLISEVSEDEGFSVCMEDTVLYGVCAECNSAR